MIAPLLLAVLATPLPRATLTTVCEVAANPGRFAHKLVRITAQYESDGIEHVMITDSTCPDVGIALHSEQHIDGEQNLVRALSFGHPGTLDKVIIGTFTGIFEASPGKVPSRIMRLKAVTDVTYKAKVR